MAVDSTPHNSWIVYSIGEQNQLMHPQYRLRSRYIKTKDPLPNMNYKQLEEALPPSYDLKPGEEPMEGDEELPGLFFEDRDLPVEQDPFVEMDPAVELAPPVELAHPVEQVLRAKKTSHAKKKKSEDHISLIPTTGSVGDEITVEAPHGLPEITEVQVDDATADFVAVSNTSLIFAIPLGATSGTVKLFNPEGEVINAGTIKIVGS